MFLIVKHYISKIDVSDKSINNSSLENLNQTDVGRSVFVFMQEQFSLEEKDIQS